MHGAGAPESGRAARRSRQASAAHRLNLAAEDHGALQPLLTRVQQIPRKTLQRELHLIRLNQAILVHEA